jgi:plastocyanin
MMKFNKRSGISSSLFFLVLCVVLVSYQNCAKDPTAVPLQIASKANNQAQAVVSPLASDPMANLKANGSSEITVNVGDLISYTWSSSNADSASSTMIMSPTADSCGNVNGSWVVNTTSGYFQPMAVLECQKGITYTLTLLAKQSASGRTASSQVIIHVNGATTTTAPIASLKANGSSEITVNVGDLVIYTWSSSNADSASSTMSMSPTADSCGNVNGAWVVNTTSGSLPPIAVLECQRGITYTLTLIAKQSASGKTASSQLKIHIN